jgi:hypothetical protein
VDDLCFSSNAIEMQAYTFTEKIQKSSVYKLVQIDLIGDQFIKMDDDLSLETMLTHGEEMPLIKAVVLSDSEGRLYTIQPNEKGLNFANGEITYDQYLRSIKNETSKLVLYTIGITGAFSLMAGTFINYFL